VKALIQDEDSHGLKMTPLIDVVFLLLVFFLVATTFYEEEKDITLQLAEATEGEVREQTFQRVVINVRSTGIIVINERIYSLTEAEAFLSEALELDDKVSVVIRCDRTALHNHFVKVLNICEKHGVKNVSVATFQTDDEDASGRGAQRE